MKDTIQIRNTFRSCSDEAMKKAVSEKIGRLIENRLKGTMRPNH